MWRDEVKAKLQEETTRWLEESASNGDREVQILSVTQLLRLLDSDSSPAGRLQHTGIARYDVSPEPARKPQSLKRPRVEEATQGEQRAVAFAATAVWITGFVRHEQIQPRPRSTTLCLCDTASRIPVHLIYPALELLDGLVLVQAWTIVVQHLSDKFPPTRFMEVHGEPVLLHQASSQKPMQFGVAISKLRAQYPTQDPPMYTGSALWGAPTAIDPGKPSKRKIHAVFGRVSSISPISTQADASSSHFFIEIENPEPSDGRRSIVNVLLAGENTIKWYPFLWPGLIILLTNLKKVYYADCEMFLLQASVADSTCMQNSSLLLWRSVDFSSHVTQFGSAIVGEGDTSIGSSVDLEGVVLAVNWDECLVIDSEPPAMVALFHYPWSQMRNLLRVGSRVHVYQAHILHCQPFGNGRVFVGLCSRSHLQLSGHANSASLVPKYRSGDQRRRIHRKWSQFGDFSRQPLALSMWWLDLLETLVQKFRFSTDSSDKHGSGFFPCVRRRNATLVIGQDLLSATAVQPTTPLTLARRFLNSHTRRYRDCPCITQSKESVDFVLDKIPTLQDLRALIEQKTREKIASLMAEEGHVSWPIQFESKDMPKIFAVGVLHGAADDLTMMDQTAKIPIIVSPCATTPVTVDSSCAVYAVGNFGAIIETLEAKLEDPSAKQHERLVITMTTSASDIQRISLCSICNSVEGSDAGASKLCNIVVYVTHIGARKRRNNMSNMVSEFLHMRGIGFRQTNERCTTVDWTSAHAVELLVNLDAESWFIQRHSWLSFRHAQLSSSIQGKTSDTKLVQWWLKMHDSMLTTPKSANNPNEEFCKAATAMWNAPGLLDDSAEVATYIVDRRSLVSQIKVLTTKRPGFVEAMDAHPVDENIAECVIQLDKLARTQSKIHAVRDLFMIDAPSDSPESEGKSADLQSDPHTARLINIEGVVLERTLYMKHRHEPKTQSHHPVLGSVESYIQASETPRMCRLKIRDTRSLEAVYVTVNEDAFGTKSALQPGARMEISMIQCFIARASFKPFLTWTHSTTARRVDTNGEVGLSSGRLFTEMPTTHLHSLYQMGRVDRTIKRFVVQLAHLSYVLLKRRCSQCKQPLTVLKRHGAWIHSIALTEATNPATLPQQHSCSWKQIAQDSPDFALNTFLGCSLRCIIDDGSAQAELFAEGDIVWELLRCSRGQRERFEALLARQTSDLSYFATRSAADALFTPPSAQENLYYQNEWRAFVQTTVASLGSVVVFAQRFYKNKPARLTPPTVLTFGKDIQVTTPSVPLVQLEAVRVDELSARSEVRRRLARLSEKGPQ